MSDKDRREAIAECERQITEAIAAQEPGGWPEFLWEMDQRRELHRLLYLESFPQK